MLEVAVRAAVTGSYSTPADRSERKIKWNWEIWNTRYLLVALEHGGSDEGFLAQVALVLLASIVHHLYVYVQRVLALKGGVALVALERPLTWTERADETWDSREEGTISSSSCTKGARLLLSCSSKLPPPLPFFCSDGFVGATLLPKVSV